MFLSRTYGTCFIISAPSGCGKSTIINYILKDTNINTSKEISMSISSTTRAPREKETDGVHYYFEKKENFLKKKKSGEFLETTKVFNYYYGTPGKNIIYSLNKGKDIILDIDWKGKEKVERFLGDRCVSIFILPPTLDTLEKRLLLRNQDDLETIKQRLKKSTQEISQSSNYDYIVINEKIEDAVDEVKSIIKAERLRFSRLINKKQFLKLIK